MSTDPAHADQDRIGTTLGGRYVLRRLIGTGAMGAVYEADDAEGRRFAIKLLLDRTHGRQQDLRFAREALISSALSNPNIASVLDSGVDAVSHAPYLVMELLSGEDLASVLERTGPLPPAVAVRILLAACAGVAAAHAAGIVHRDIKPSNIFLHRAGGSASIVKVFDFGLAKQLFGDDSMTESGSVIGSPAYMSPEQARNAKRVDSRTDVWSLAMTLYEMLTGTTAFHDHQTVYTLVIALATEDVPSIQDAGPWVPPALATVIHGALLRDIDARCPSVTALADALWPFAEGSLELDTTMFVPLALEQRRAPAPRGLLPTSWTDVGCRATSFAPPPFPDDPVARLVGQSLAGRYSLLRVLGHGGMGAVYETRSHDGERLAVKVLLGHADRWKPAALSQFVVEARALTAIRSEHVVRVVDADTDLVERVPFVVMEVLEGENLATLLRSGRAIETDHIARIFVEACRGLAAAHALGIVHRNIKPANIFLHGRPGGRSITKICDFGLAKVALDDGDTTFFSPEQSRDPASVDHRTDIWSLALALYEAGSGRRPWETGARELPPLHEYAPWISRAFGEVVHRGLRREATERYASMDEFADALEPFCEPGPPR